MITINTGYIFVKPSDAFKAIVAKTSAITAILSKTTIAYFLFSEDTLFNGVSLS